MTAPTLLAAAGHDQVARLRDAACAAQLAGDAQAVADLTWQIQQLNPTPPTAQGDDVTMIQDCPRFIDHSGHGHSCDRCAPNRPDLVEETAP